MKRRREHRLPKLNTATFMTHSQRKLAREANNLKNKWRLLDIASAVFGLSALCLAIVDYEKRWSDERTHSKCRMTNITDGYRYGILMLTIGAIVFAILRHVTRVQWVNTFSLARDIYMPKHATLISAKFVIELVVLAIFPYPGLESELYIYEALDNSITLSRLCYYWSEMLFIGMFMRVVLCFRALVNYNKYLSDTCYAYCKDIEIKPTVRYAYRNMIRESPFTVVVVILVVATLIVTLIIRVFERPIEDISSLNFKQILSSLWLTTETIFNCAYGDMYPSTTGGRGVSIITSVVGVCLFSYLIFLIEKALSLTPNERKVFVKINLVPTAARVVFVSLRFFSIKKIHGAASPQAKQLYNELLKALDKHSRMIEYLQGKASIADEIGVEVQSKKLMIMVRRIERKVNRLVKESEANSKMQLENLELSMFETG